MLAGKTILITGGGTGIGRATAVRCAEEGAEIWIVGRKIDPLRETAEYIGSRCHYQTCDVSDAAALASVIDALPRLDVFVSNAAVSVPTPLDNVDGFRKVFEINFWGAVRGCIHAGQRMIREKTAGRIVIVSSVQAQIAEPGSAAYGMAKAGLNQLTRQLAAEWAGYDILVNTVAPGFIITPMSYVGGENECESEWFKTFFVHSERPRIPLMRPGRAEEAAEAVLFFANPKNSYCTGQVLTVDGGMTIRL